MEYSQTQKGNPVVLYKGFEYIKSRVNEDGMTTWRCRAHPATRCKALLKTREDEVVGEDPKHCHESNIQKAKANILRAQMREEIKKIGATPKKVIESVLSHANEHVLKHLPRRSSLARTLRRDNPHLDQDETDSDMDDSYISNPTTIDFTIPGKFTSIILHDTGAKDPERILAIGNAEMLLELNKESVYGDGTFDKSPPLFDQLYTWHAKVGSSYPPCVYFLLRKRNLETYGRMFSVMKELMPTFSPHEILMDFEESVMSAAQLAFPSAEVKGCYFHLCQNLIKKISSVGLKEVYDMDIDMKLKLMSLAALSFVPMIEVKDIFNQLAATFPEDLCYTEVLTYFFTAFVEGVAGRPAKFPVALWNHYEDADDGCPKTTNLCKCFHTVVNSLLHRSNSGIFNLMEGLKKNMASHCGLLAKVEVEEPKAKRRKSTARPNQVAKTVQGYQNEIDKLVYLCQMANLQC